MGAKVTGSLLLQVLKLHLQKHFIGFSDVVQDPYDPLDPPTGTQTENLNIIQSTEQPIHENFITKITFLREIQQAMKILGYICSKI